MSKPEAALNISRMDHKSSWSLIKMDTLISTHNNYYILLDSKTFLLIAKTQ